VLQAVDDAVGRHLRGVLPARGRHVAPARVDADDDPLAVGAEHVVEEVDVAVRGGAQDHALGARSQRVAHRRQRAQAAAVLHRHGQLVGDVLEMVEALRRAAARAVEVDDVQEARAGLDPCARRLQRRVAVDRLLVEVAPDEADGLTLGDVDRRVEDHRAGVRAQIAVKLRSSASPWVEDFSGWN
jgi:hypothetical protein